MSVGLRASVYVVVGLAALVWFVPSLMADLSPSPLFFIGLPIAFLGLGIYVWTVWLFVSAGRGTPVPLDPPRILVVRGPYRVVRNPMAVGFVVIFVGEAIAFGSMEILAYAALLFLAIHLFIVLVEEPGLKRRFGTPYTTYLESVPRWLPRIAARRPSMPDHHRPTRGGRRA